MAPARSKQDVEDFLRLWLADNFGFDENVLFPEQLLAIDFGVSGEDSRFLLEELHQRFGTDFSELDHDAAFGVDISPPVGLAMVHYYLGELLALRILQSVGVTGLRSSLPPLVVPGRDGWMCVGDLVDAVARGAWTGRVSSQRYGSIPRRAPRGRRVAGAVGAYNRVASAVIADCTRGRVTRPGRLPDRAFRDPEEGFHRERRIQCPWCLRRELVALDLPGPDWIYACLDCGGLAALLDWSRTMRTFLGGYGIRLLLLAMPGIPFLLHWPGATLLGLFASLGIGGYLLTGVGQTRRLPGGAPPQPPSPT